MRTLWFKQCYVGPILSGEKADTIRRPSDRLPSPGDVVGLAVGPRPPFATAMVTAREEIRLCDVSAGRRAELEAIYGPDHPILVRLAFELV